MQVSAYKIVSLYGIQALSNFWSIDNEQEVNQARQDWAFINQDIFELSSFNDGNNTFEVVFNKQDSIAFRSDSGIDVTLDYQLDIVKLLLKIDDARSKFDLPRTALAGFLSK